MLRKLLCLGFFVIFIKPGSVFALGDFQIDLNDKYTFSESGSCQVFSKVALTNLRSDTYATSYQLRFSESPPPNLTGNDSVGPLQINVSTDGSNSVFDISFNEPVVGKDSTQYFSLSYSCPDARLKGQIWDINLPKLSNPDSIYSYNLELEVPSTFGKPAYILPAPVYSHNNLFRFTKNQLSENGIIASFGNFQTYSFTIEYPLRNPTNKTQSVSIAVPPDTSYQKVQYSEILPSPHLVSVDEDGNWLASFNVSPGTDLTATVSGTVNVYPIPFSLPEPVTDDQLKEYLKPTNIWPSDQIVIKELSKKYSTPGEIYNYVVKTLNYDNLRATGSAIIRKGASFALENPDNSLCTEFTDLFIAIARAAGIPAREIEGFGYSSDTRTRPLNLKQTLHAWPEYWDNKMQTWVGVDPTWEKTTGRVDYFNQLGFEHFAIAIHGKNYPEPYLSSENITLGFSEYIDVTESPLEVNWEKPFQIVPFFSFPSQMVIKNSRGNAVYKSFFTISSNLPGSFQEFHKFIPVIPPYGSVNIPVSLKNTFLPSFNSHILSISNSNQTIKYNIPRNLFIVWYIFYASFCAIGLILLAGIAIRSWSISVQRRRSKNNLRR